MKTKSDGTTASNVELSNEDPITGEPGSHPMGTGLGAALGGALAGAVTGTLAGPIGTVVGTVAGGVAGAYAGRAIAENVDPTVETAYWRDAYEDRPYYSDDYSFDDYEPAYRSGWETYEPDLNWRERESDAKSRWEAEGGATTMTWDQAKLAAEDAYGRINERAANKPR